MRLVNTHPLTVGLVVLFISMFAAAAQAKSVTAVALFNERAMISVDGSKAKIVRAGGSYKGVTLISSSTDEAVIEFDGQRQVLTLNSATVLTESLAAGPSASYAETVTLFVNELGFFESEGNIDGKPIRFLVDTGANIVVLSSAQADRVGLEYRDGVKTFASTASGTAPMYGVTLNTIGIGGIQLNNIRAGVIIGNFPEKPLLGMTFLNRLEMSRSGNTMILKRR